MNFNNPKTRARHLGRIRLTIKMKDLQSRRSPLLRKHDLSALEQFKDEVKDLEGDRT